MGDAGSEQGALRDLGELMASGGWRFLPGPPNAVVVIRAWPDGSVDTLAVRGESEALAERTNAIGHPVWRRVGALADIITELRGLPTPDAPDAPRLVLPRDSADRHL